MSVFITNTTKHTAPNLPYSQIQEKLLGKKYELSLIFIGEKRARALNKKHRDKDYIPNVLSFPLDNTIGEIYICLPRMNQESKKFDLTPEGTLLMLFIHGVLHLKGYEHGDAMERLERKTLNTYNLTKHT